MSAAVLYVYMRSLYARRVIPLCLVVVFHNTDTHIYILSLDFALLIHNKQLLLLLLEKSWIRQERRWEFQLHSQEDQDFSVVETASRQITEKSNQSRNLDLTNNGMDNHYLTDVDHGSHCLTRHRTTSLTYMSDQTSEGTEFREYMWGYLLRTERRGIRTATKFVGPSPGHSGRKFCSSVTKVTELMFLQTSHSPLTITGEKHTVVSRQHMVTCSCSPSLPVCCVCSMLEDLMSCFSWKNRWNAKSRPTFWH